jgi:hypothetical protein
MYVNEPTGWRDAGTVSGETRVKNSVRMRYVMCAWVSSEGGRIHQNVNIFPQAVSNLGYICMGMSLPVGTVLGQLAVKRA